MPGFAAQDLRPLMHDANRVNFPARAEKLTWIDDDREPIGIPAKVKIKQREAGLSGNQHLLRRGERKILDG